LHRPPSPDKSFFADHFLERLSALVAAVYDCQGFPLPLNAEVLLDPIPWFFERKCSPSQVSPEELQKVTPTAFLEFDF
jgi:hypothetical protein